MKLQGRGRSSGGNQREKAGGVGHTIFHVLSDTKEVLACMPGQAGV